MSLTHSVHEDGLSTAILDVLFERYRQQQYRNEGRFAYTAADDTSDYHRLAMLIEEVGEVSRELQSAEPDQKALYKELIQVAAIAVAWCEGINRRATKTVAA